MGEVERTFLMVKPDGLQRGHVGDVIERAERKGLRLVALKMLEVGEGTAREHYAEHRRKDFYESLVAYIQSSPSVAMVLEGREAVSVVRNLIGATDPAEARPGTVRGDLGLDVGRNVVHAADSREAAEREIGLYFEEDDLLDYERSEEAWVYE